MEKKPVVIDMHVHPSLKIFLFNKKFYRRYRTGGAWNPLAMRVDLPKIKAGGVNVIFSSIYLPEEKLIRDCGILTIAAGILGGKFRNLVSGDPFRLAMKVLDGFEAAVLAANHHGRFQAEIARSGSGLQRILAENKIGVVHTIEGAHSLAGRLENLYRFFNRGVALLTLAHFYENAAARTVGGIPENKKLLGCFRNSIEQSAGLTEFGHQVVEEMIRIGMIVDLTHCTPRERDQVYALNRGRRPLVFSHVGVRAMKKAAMNPSEAEIMRIADCGGVIGVIFMNFWLKSDEKKNGLDLIVETIQYLKNKGGIDCVAIGSDFDGFTDPPDDIKDIAQMPGLQERLLTAGFKEDEIEKIMGKNVLRVLREGWGRR